MPIDRHALVMRHNPTLTAPNPATPLSVGNGNFAFTADVTGLQSLYGLYAETTPLCTMANWGWHAFPDTHTHDEVALTEYDYNGRTVRYAVEKQAGNEQVYDWLRQNPHRLNLARTGLLLDGAEIDPAQLSSVEQTLNLWEGILYSAFTLDGFAVHVQTACAPGEDTLAFEITADPALARRLTVALDFPYGNPKISASDWGAPERHTTTVAGRRILRRVDATEYVVASSARPEQVGAHRVVVQGLAFSFRFSPEGAEPLSPELVFAQSKDHWARFWSTGGAVELAGSSDPRAHELERRVVLSQYLTAIQCAGDLPPAETGLTCNSWYGKFHLEMLPSHCAWMPLWGRGALLERVLPWYHTILPNARANAAKNGYAGARWPKMTGPEGIDSPSIIATLLVWQQPHIIWLLELLRRERGEQRDVTFLRNQWELVSATADFMADYPVYNAGTDQYDLVAPLIPVQEEHDPRVVKNPTFEVEYWREGLQIALAWAQQLGIDPPAKWRDVAERMAPAPAAGGLYLAHEACPDTFERFNRDHPSMLFAYGMLRGERMDASTVRTTLERVLREWEYGTLWGWDFGQMAMTATRLGMADLAVDILLADTVKNTYVTSGNNFQRGRSDLPLYLPGNGTLLLAVGMMCAGYDGCASPTPGFPSGWQVDYENISPIP